jgi:iron complex outermembrane recepter protein
MKSWRFAYSNKCFVISLDIYLWLVVSVVGIIGGIVAQSVQALASEKKQDTAIVKIQTLSEIKFPATSVKDLFSQSPTNPPSQGSVVIITGVKANPTDKGVEVILQTTGGEQLQINNRSTENNFIADIPNAQLRLPNGDAFTFRSQNPIEGITEITVTNFDANTIRVTVTGETGLPTVELFDSDEGLIFGLTPAATAMQPPQQPEPEQPTSETTQDESAAQQDEPIELVVTGEQDGYRVTDSSTGTRTDTPLRDIPQSIQVVPRQVIEDQGVTNLREALRNVPGVSQGTNPSGRGAFDLPVIRGFSAGSDILRNGLKDPTNQYIGFEAAGLERIEVLKGPASVLFGQGSLGGVVNYVTKQPLTEPYYSLEASVGNFNFYRGAFDFSGPLNDSQTLLYRLNAAASTTESFLDFYDEQKYFVAPVLSWQISDRTKLTLQTEYLNRIKDYGQQGLPAVGTILPNPNGKIPRDRNISESDTADDLRAIRVSYDFEHRLSENWQIRNAFGSSWIRRDRENHIFATALATDNRTLSRSYLQGGNDVRFFNLDTYVVGKFATGSIQHQLVTGFNLTRSESDLQFIFRQAAAIDFYGFKSRQ